MSPVVEKALAENRDELTQDEAATYVEGQIRDHLGIGLDEFRAAAERDDIDHEDPVVIHLALLAGVELHTC